MNNKNIEILSKLRNFICHHSDFSNALTSIDECMQMSYLNNRPVGSLLLGEGGVGKSTICKLIKSKHKRYKCIEDNFEKLIVPAFYFPVPSPITIKSLAIRMLEELGCTVVMASDGLEALELWKHATFDRVLTDVNMPRMNGYELTTQLRNFDNQVPIIGATANAQQEERARCLAVGMDECLVKPFGLSALFICLEQTERVSNVL